MKKWLKTIPVFVCILALCAMLTACGGSAKSAPDPDAVELTQEQEQQWYDSAEQFILSMDEAVETGTSVMSAEDPVYGPALDSWENARKDIGEILSIEGSSAVFTKTDGTVRMLVDGSSHDAEVVFSVEMGDSYSNITGITTNVIYSFGELMQQAGMNTLLGMGTTFAVLILLSLIIALFGRLIGGAGARKTKPSAAAEASDKAAASDSAVQDDTDYADDAALVAVIAAVVAAYEGKASADGFVVRSIRKSRRRF